MVHIPQLKAISETELEVTVPFKVPPSTKSFNAANDVTSNLINIDNHFFGTGTRVIYDAKGGTVVGGLTDGADYWISIVDNDYFKVCASESDAQNGTGIAVTAGSGLQRFYSSNLSGEVTGPGTLTISSGSRTITGDQPLHSRDSSRLEMY